MIWTAMNKSTLLKKNIQLLFSLLTRESSFFGIWGQKSHLKHLQLWNTQQFRMLVVNNHGDRFCPLIFWLWDPFQTTIFMAYKWGWSYPLTTWDDPPSMFDLTIQDPGFPSTTVSTSGPAATISPWNGTASNPRDGFWPKSAEKHPYCTTNLGFRSCVVVKLWKEKYWQRERKNEWASFPWSSMFSSSVSVGWKDDSQMVQPHSLWISMLSLPWRNISWWSAYLPMP